MDKKILENITSYLEYGNFSADAKKEDVINSCDVAKQYGFVHFIVAASNIPLAKEQLKGTNIHVGSVVDYPFGNSTTAAKAFEAKECARLGADEIDTVMNIGKFLEEDYDYVINDLTEIVKSFKSENQNNIVKVILETSLIGFDKIEKAVECVVKSGADFIKTSSGYAKHGATFEHVEEMARAARGRVKIKASGGIRTLEETYKYIELGAVRFGGSGNIKIAEEAKQKLKEM